MQVLRVLVISTLLALASLRAHAQDTEVFEYANVDNWTIHVDSSIGFGCFAMAEYEGGSVIRFGANLADDNLYVVFGDPNWRSIEYGKTYPIEVTFGDETPWSGEATGLSFDPPEDQPYLRLIVADDAGSLETFLMEFMQEQDVKVRYQGREILRLSLRGSYRAGETLIECQNRIIDIQEGIEVEPTGRDNPAPLDPFEIAPTSTDSDPFDDA